MELRHLALIDTAAGVGDTKPQNILLLKTILFLKSLAMSLLTLCIYMHSTILMSHIATCYKTMNFD